MSRQQFSLRWNNYLRHVTNAFDSLRCQEDLVDVTLCCEGKKIRAHKMLLSACSTYFKDIFKENPCQHPVIIFRNVRYDDLCAIINFMYHGEVNIVQEQLASFLTTAELLEVQGLTDGTDDNKDLEGNNELEVIKNQLSSDEMDISSPIFQAKKRKLSLNNFKRHRESDTETAEACSEIGIIELDTVHPENNLKSENADHIDERDSTVLAGSSVISFPEEIEICSSEVFRNTNILNEFKSSEGNNLTAENPHDVGVDPALKDTSQGLLDWNGLLSTQNQMPANLVSLSTTGSPTKELKSFQFDRKLITLNSEKVITVSKCNICDKVFTHPNSLTHHRRSHNGETQCTLCPKQYTRAYDLKRHMRTTHRDHMLSNNSGNNVLENK